MARKCVCKICKANGNTDLFYKVTDENGKSKYYCSKDEYETYLNERVKRENLLKYIAEEVLEYEENQIIPPVMFKKIQELNMFYDYDVIFKCFETNKLDIQFWIKTKNFTSEFGMVSYIIKIIENKINDTYNQWKRENKQIKQQESSNIDLEIINDASLKINTQTNNGILDFLEDDDI